jgi:fumarate hydratase class I
LPRHAASCPVGLGVSCSADRNIKITKDGIFVEQLSKSANCCQTAPHLEPAVDIDLNQPMADILKNCHIQSKRD